MSDTSKPGQQGDKDAKAKAERITAADNEETKQSQDRLESAAASASTASQVPDLAEQESRERPRRKRAAKDPLTAPRFRVEFNAVGTFLKGEVLPKEKISPDNEVIRPLIESGAIKPLWGDEDEDEE